MSRGAKAWRSSESSIGIRTSLRERRGDDRLHSTAHREITDDRHASRLTRGDEIVEDLIGGRLEEDPAISVAKHVVLQRLQLDATIAGHVADADFTEVGKAGLGADRGELRTADRDLEVPLRARIGKRFDHDLA